MGSTEAARRAGSHAANHDAPICSCSFNTLSWKRPSRSKPSLEHRPCHLGSSRMKGRYSLRKAASGSVRIALRAGK